MKLSDGTSKDQSVQTVKYLKGTPDGNPFWRMNNLLKIEASSM